MQRAYDISGQNHCIKRGHSNGNGLLAKSSGEEGKLFTVRAGWRSGWPAPECCRLSWSSSVRLRDGS